MLRKTYSTFLTYYKIKDVPRCVVTSLTDLKLIEMKKSIFCRDGANDYIGITLLWQHGSNNLVDSLAL